MQGRERTRGVWPARSCGSADDGIEVVELTTDVFTAGLDLYEMRPDKDYSLADCVCMQVMRQSGISEALTYDHHFEQEGFVALLR